MTAETMSGTAKVHLGAPWYRHKIILEKPGRGSIIDATQYAIVVQHEMSIQPWHFIGY